MSDREPHEKQPDSSSGVDNAPPDDASARQTTPMDKEALATVASTPADETHYLQGIKLLLVMAAVTLVMLLAMLDISIIATVSWASVHLCPPESPLPIVNFKLTRTSIQAIPQITSDFHRLEDVGWYIGAFQLARSVLPFAPSLAQTHVN